MRRPATAALTTVLLLLAVSPETSALGATWTNDPGTTPVIDRLEPGTVGSAWRPFSLDPNRKTTVVLELASSPIARFEADAIRAGRTLSDQEETTVRAALRARQDALRPSLAAMGARILGQYQDAYDGIKVRVATRDVGRLEGLPGVRRVVAVPVYHLSNVNSDAFTGVPAAWGAVAGATGRGVRIGIIDSGIDYYHADFGGSGNPADFSADDGLTIGTPAFPNQKVAGGYDFVGNGYDPAGEGDATVPHPDPDPLDCEGHGTHVAATAAGFGITTDGTTFHGPYTTTTLSTQSFLIGPGVAPEAQLYALRIFGCSGSTDMVVDAIDWAVKNHLDVISMSLGSAFGDPASPDAVAADNAAKAGIIVVAAAGNDGPGAYTGSAPGAASRAIEVAAVDAVASIPGVSIGVGNGVTAIDANEASGLPVTGRLVVPSYMSGGIILGCRAEEYGGVQPGDIVVTRRGSCPRTDRATLGQAAGAAAVIMVNNSDGDIFPPLEGPINGVTIPFLGVTMSATAALETADGASVTITGRTIMANPEYRAAADFSSGGPASNGALKPDIAAPGVSVFSAAVGTGTGGIRESGTSMSTPHVAGVAALVRQVHPDWTSEQVKAAIMNTATAALVGYDPRIAGAGLIQPAAAVRTVALATTGSGTASLSFGARALDGPLAVSKTIRIQNGGQTAIGYRLTTKFVGPALGVHVKITPATVTVAPGRAVTVSVKLSLDAAAVALLPAADAPRDAALGLTSIRGAIVITPTAKGVGVFVLRVPFLLLPRALSRTEAPATVGLSPDSTSGHDVGSVSLTNVGIRAGAADVFAWGLDSAPTSVASLDVRAVGVQSLATGADGLPLQTDDRLLVFAINTWRPWSSPGVNEFDILINPDGSGKPTYVVAALDHGLVINGSPDGREGCFVVRVADLAVTEAVFARSPLNSTTLRCGVLASEIAVTGGAFTYGVEAASLRSPDMLAVPGTASFNPFQPSVSQGDHLDLGPGQSANVPLWVDRAALATAPALGWMLVGSDNPVGPAQAATIPVPPTGP